MQHSKGDRLFYILNDALLLCISLTCLIPLVHLVAISFSDYHHIVSGFVTLYPLGWTLENYEALFQGSPVAQAFANSVVITVGGVVLSMLFTILAAYPLSREYCIGRRYIILAFIFTMLFQGGLIPTFLVVKAFGLLNTYFALWFTGLISTFNMLIMKTFFQEIPEELVDSAKIDGCGEWMAMFRIILPLSKPVLATLSLFYGVGYWNAFFAVLIYINQSAKYNLTVLVQKMIQSSQLIEELNLLSRLGNGMFLTPEGIKAAGILVLIVPMLLVYPFIQKYFIKGVMLGAIKG